jgi:hypothetical protein
MCQDSNASALQINYLQNIYRVFTGPIQTD